MIYSTLVRRAVAGMLVAGALAIPVHRATAQKAHAASADRDAQTLADYTLTESGLRKYYKAMENLTKAAMKDPSLQEQFETVSASNDEDISAIGSQYDHVPALKAAVAEAGLTSTEFTTFSLSYMQAAMAYGLMTQGPAARMRRGSLPPRMF